MHSNISPPSLQEVIDYYQLIPHREGGFYYRTHRSEIIISKDFLPERFEGNRSLSSTIIYLVTKEARCKLHRLKAEEIWHFYMGSPFTLIELYDDGQIRQTKMGNHILNGYRIQHLVPHDCWFGGFVEPQGAYSLMGCTLSPGFDDNDFQFADKEFLLHHFPQHKEILIPFFN